MESTNRINYLKMARLNVNKYFNLLKAEVENNVDSNGLICISAYDIHDMVSMLGYYKDSLRRIIVSDEDAIKENQILKDENKMLKDENERLRKELSLLQTLDEYLNRMDENYAAVETAAKCALSLIEDNAKVIKTSTDMKNNIQKINKSKSKININEAIQLYSEDLWSIQDIADKYGVSYQAVRKRLLESGIRLRDERVKHK